MSRARRLAFVVALLQAPAAAGGQAVQGSVIDRAQLPVPGVVVLLLDTAGRVTGRSLTNDRGKYRLIAPRQGTYFLRTQRIGFRQSTSDPIVVPEGSALTYSLMVADVASSLDTIQVRGRNVCRSRPDSAAATFAIWEQVRTALMATQLTSAAQDVVTHVLRHERAFDPTRGRVSRRTSTPSSTIGAQAWRSLPAESLRKTGYVTWTPDGSVTFYAPDLEALISERFLEDHCVRLDARSDDVRVGIAFEPTRERRRIPEIRGTVWVDRHTSELRSIDFRYVNIPPELEAANAGGEATFRRLSSGTWVIARWNIRMPVVETERIPNTGGYTTRLVAIHDHGGELVLVMRGIDTLWRDASVAIVEGDKAREAGVVSDRAKLVGLVLSDVNAQPIADVEVALPGLSKIAVSNPQGAFRLDDVPAGVHDVTVRRLGFKLVTTTLEFSDGRTVERNFALSRVVVLDTVAVSATPFERLMREFDENRAIGLGRFWTRAELAKLEGVPTYLILSQVSGLAIIRGKANHAWVGRGRATVITLGGSNATPALDGHDIQLGAPEGTCYAHVYVDNVPRYTGRNREPLFDISRITAAEIEAIEYYANPAQTPMRYSTLNSACGTLVIWTRRSR